MCRFQPPIVNAVVALLLGITARTGAAGDAPSTSPEALTRLPGTIYRVVRHLDGSAVCCTDEGVFFTSGDPHRWSALRNLPKRVSGFLLWPLGGDATRFFAAGDMYAFDHRLADNAYASVDHYALAAVNTGGEFRIVWDKSPGGDYESSRKTAAFASKDVGALAWSEHVQGAPLRVDAAGKMLPPPIKSTLYLTVDGGATWEPLSAPLSDSQAIARLLWVSPSRLLIADWGGSVQLVERRGDAALAPLWSASVGGGDWELVLDGQHVWGGRGPMKRLKLADGSVDATVRVPALPWGECKRVACCYGRLVVDAWDEKVTAPQPFRVYQSFEESVAASRRDAAAVAQGRRLDVWARDPKSGYVRRARIPAPEIVAVLPLKEPLCLAFTRDGRGMRLDLDKGELSPVDLEVTPLPPPPPPPVDPNIATKAQMRAMDDLAKRVPGAERNAIYEAVVKRRDLTHKQQVELAIEKFRHYLETAKPGPVADPPPPTPEEMRIEMELGRQVPLPERTAIVLEASKKTGLTDRERVLWVTQQYREYLERRKPEDKEPRGPKRQSPGETRKE